MRLTVFTDYSLRVLMVLTSHAEEMVTISDIAEAFDISQAHLMKVTHVLGKTGWVETVRGRNGGMRLSANPRTLKLGQMIAKLEHDFGLVECMTEINHCVLTGGCGLAVALDEALKTFFRELDRYTLADLIDKSPALTKLALWQPVTWKPAAGRRKT